MTREKAREKAEGERELWRDVCEGIGKHELANETHKAK